MSKPKIGLINFVFYDMNPDFFVIQGSYIEAIIDAGGIPVIIPVTEHLEDCSTYLDMVDALLIPGGEDVSPEFYGEDPVQKVNYINHTKDLYEFEMIRIAREQNKPIMAICRGMQVVNVALGGTLYQDLPSQLPNSICHQQSRDIRSTGTHKVTIKADTLLHRLLGDSVMANSYHHQAVKEIAPGLIVTAHTNDGVVEALESADGRIFAVQWHPERMYKSNPIFKNLFTHLVELASK